MVLRLETLLGAWVECGLVAEAGEVRGLWISVEGEGKIRRLNFRPVLRPRRPRAEEAERV